LIIVRPGALSQIAERRGWDVVGIYRDAGISGAKGRDGRPGLDAMLKDASRRKRNMATSKSASAVPMLTPTSCGRHEPSLPRASVSTEWPRQLVSVSARFRNLRTKCSSPKWWPPRKSRQAQGEAHVASVLSRDAEDWTAHNAALLRDPEKVGRFAGIARAQADGKMEGKVQARSAAVYRIREAA
jgi:hypothetical protein